MKLFTGKLLSLVFLLNLLFFIGVGLVTGVTYQPHGPKQHGVVYHAKAGDVQNNSFIAEEIEVDEDEEDGNENNKPTPFHACGFFQTDFSLLHNSFFTKTILLNGRDLTGHATKVQPYILNCVFRV